MGGIAGIIHWDEQPVESAQMHHMMQIIQHRGPQGLNWKTKGHVGFGHALLALKNHDLQHPQPVWLPDESCGIVADARLYNREDLLSRLGDVTWLRKNPSDATLILAAYERWGEGLLDIIDGDFAFAVWDEKRQRLFAARDPFGVKPFFYRQDGKRFLFGSEPKQILVMPEIAAEPDDLIVGEYLLDRFQESERTYFRGICRLKPAHFLVATPEGVVQNQYWKPDRAKEIHYPNPREYFDHFRELFEQAVAKRLQTDFPVAVELSGGYDSSSIVVMAKEIYGNGKKGLPPLETISATYGDLPCDESEYIQAVAEEIPFRSHLFCPLGESSGEGADFSIRDLIEDMRQGDSPEGDLARARTLQSARILSGFGARTLITGLGGDELATEPDYLLDLVSRKKFMRVLQECMIVSRTYESETFAGLLWVALKSLAPEPIKHLYRVARGSRRLGLPGWINPEFARFYTRSARVSSPPGSGFKSLAQGSIFQWLTSARNCWGLEQSERQGAYNGFEVRHPFFDRPLAEFVLQIPFDQRISSEGEFKYILRQALSSHLPEKILRRNNKVTFCSYFNHLTAKWKPRLEKAVFSSASWASAPYVDKQKATLLFRGRVPQKDTFWRISNRPFWAIGTLELWLRSLDRYQLSTTFPNRQKEVTTHV